jgi:hypothetical protein
MEEEDLQFPERASASLPTSESLGLEVLTPQMATADMPEAWGGRPRGTTRRAIRMQKAWDDERKIALEEQENARKQYEFNRASEILARKQSMDESRYDREMEEYSAKQKLDAQKEFERQAFTSALNKLDPSSDDFNKQLVETYRLYPLAAVVPEVKAMVDEYKLANSVYRDARKEEQQDKKINKAFLVQQEATASELGIDTSKFVDPETGILDQVSLMKRIGEARREKTEEAEKRSERKSLDKEKRDAAKPLIREIRDINDELEAAVATAQTSKGKVQQEALNSVKLLESRLSRRENELLTIIGTPEEEPQRPEISKEAVDAARKAIRDNPDSPQAQAARQIIEAYEASQPKLPAGEEGGGETISEPETIPTPTAAAPSEQPPFLTQEQQESIPQTRREFATGEMAETLDSMDKIKTEADRLYKIRFTSKENMEKYEALQAQLSEKRKEDSKLRAARRKEIREEMKKLGPYSSGENRKKYVALERELRLISGV